MKNNTTKIITFIGTVALSLSALFVSVGSASGGNPFGANPPQFFEPIPEIPIEQIVDVNEPTVQYDNTCNPFHEVDIMITNNSVGLDQEFSVYVIPENAETALPLYADNHIEVASMSSVVIDFDGDFSSNFDLNILVYLNPMDMDNPLVDVSIDACELVILWPIPEGVDEPGDDTPEVIEEDNIIDDSDDNEPVQADDNDDSDDNEPVQADDNEPVNVWENTTNNNSLNNNEGNTPIIEEIGKPAKPKVDPEDPKDTDSSDEIASSEGKDSQEKSGLSILWIILIIVGGVVTVGTTTRAIQKNNN